jgi:hypothetical protein
VESQSISVLFKKIVDNFFVSGISDSEKTKEKHDTNKEGDYEIKVQRERMFYFLFSIVVLIISSQYSWV